MWHKSQLCCLLFTEAKGQGEQGNYSSIELTLMDSLMTIDSLKGSLMYRTDLESSASIISIAQGLQLKETNEVSQLIEIRIEFLVLIHEFDLYLDGMSY